MAMDLAVQTFSTKPDYLIAGTDIRITTAVKEAGAALTRGMVVCLADGKLTQPAVTGSADPYTVATTGMYGIVADDAANGKDTVVYLTGEFLPMHWCCQNTPRPQTWKSPCATLAFS